METETDKVKRLLDLAAALSSAQAKETGNPKLDMGGIMAVLALAKQEEDTENKKIIPHTSLYNGEKTSSSYTKTYSSSSSTVSSRVLNITENETVTDANTEQRETTEGFLHHYSQERIEARTGEKPNIEGNSSGGDKIFEQTKNNYGVKVAGKKGFFDSISDTRSGTSSFDSSPANSSQVIGKTSDRQEKISETSQHLSNIAQLSGSANNERVTDAKKKGREHMSFDKNFGAKVAGRKAIFESISDNKSESPSSNSSSESNSPVIGKKYEKQESSSATKENLSKTNGKKTHFTGSAAIAKMLQEKRNVGEAWKNDDEQGSNTADKKTIKITQPEDYEKNTPPCQLKKVRNIFETKNTELSNSITQNSTENNDQTVHSEIKTCNSKKYTSKGLQRRLTQLLDPKDTEVTKFLAAISSLSSVQEEKTGDGRLDMQGILNAISIARGCDKQKDAMDNTDNLEGNKVSKAEKDSNIREKHSSSSYKHEVEGNYMHRETNYSAQSSFENIKNEKQTNNYPQKVNKSSIQNTNTWNEDLKGTKISSGFHHVEVVNISNDIHDMSNRESKITSDIENSKHSVVSELKNMFNNNDSEDRNQTISNTKVRGYKLPPTTPVDPENIDPQNPTVKRVVYNQYREMLKSYSVSSQSQ